VRHVAQTFELAGFPDPRREVGARDLDLPFKYMLQAYHLDDPPPQPQLALPVHTIKCAGRTSEAPSPDPHVQATADLIVTAFFFLLRVGEYTMPSQTRRTRTVQFRLQDVRFWKNGLLLPLGAPLNTLLQADGVTLVIDNQKNGVRGVANHQYAASGQDPNFCPVKALARRVFYVRSKTEDLSTPLSYLSPNKHVVANDILRAVRAAAVTTGLARQGYSSRRIGAHSLRASGAMALSLNHVKTDKILKLGRWSGKTYLTYIHSQIAALNRGLSTLMTNDIPFLNVG
jgi:hypothetical protein